MSTAMIVAAPASREPAMAAAPTPPQPITATESPRPTFAGVDRRAQSGHHPAAQQPGDRRLGGRIDLGALPGRDQGLVEKRPDAERRRELGAVGRGSSSGWR